MHENGKLAELISAVSGDFESLYEIIVMALVKTIPGLTGDEIVLAFRDVSQRIDEMNVEQQAILDDELGLVRRILTLCDGLPDDVTIGEAVQLRADEGNEFAKWVLRNPQVLAKELTLPAE